MTELEKDLEKFNCEVCPYKARLEKEHGDDAVCWQWTDGSCSIYALQWAAAHLAELGYVKVDDQLRRFIAGVSDQLQKAQYAEAAAANLNDFESVTEAYEARRMAEWMQIRLANEFIKLCSEGERVVAESATGEEVRNGR